MADTKPRASRPRRVKRAASSALAPVRGSIRTKGVVTIPQDIRHQVDLNEGDEVIFTVEDGKVVLTPAAVVPRDQTWFWTPDWQAKETEAEADIATSRVTRHETDEEFLASLDAD
ncbi:MAG: AbrB/MazE/SpoVT family DNA-binding domain-containing protein [Micromonosporaceae bacterium]|nr:AbrB/MazE/SpoVT family DNA-binding domain-containing protein [Micromonosporaceae bacterium]